MATVSESLLRRRCSALQVHQLSSGKLLADLPDLHSSPVSALLFFRPLRLLLTGSKDGTSKSQTLQ